MDETRSAIHQRLQRFIDRPADWDSYGGRPLDPAVAANAEQFLVGLAGQEHYVAPSLVPTSLGGLSLEWHAGDREFSIEYRPNEIGPALEILIFFSDGAGGEEWELPIRDADVTQIDAAFARVVGAR